jgi:hypothetical protein
MFVLEKSMKGTPGREISKTETLPKGHGDVCSIIVAAIKDFLWDKIGNLRLDCKRLSGTG